jgi:uncharacterized protein (TIGR01244 family)
MRLSFVLAVMAAGSVALGAQKMERPGITNYTKVDAVVACGGATEAGALEALKNDGFQAVINLREATEAGANIEENAAKAKALGLNYIHLPLNGQSPQAKTVDDFLSAVSNTANHPVFIHCGSANRVGAVWLIKRVLKDGWTVPKATEEAKIIGLRSAPLEQFALKYIEDHKK